MNDTDEQLAWSAFEREYRATHDPRVALRAAMLDFVGRLPAKRGRPAGAPRPMLARHRDMVETLCHELCADLELTCSATYSGPPETISRGVLVGIFTDRGLSARRIAEGFGMSTSVVQRCRYERRQGQPEWERLIAKYAPKENA